MMRNADFGVLNLTPFRGPSADVGTVFELGMLAGLGKPVFAYTNDDEDFLSRVKRAVPAHFDAATKIWRDSAGMTIENFGNVDNHQTKEERRFRDLTAFEACLRLAADSLRPEIKSSFRA
jgi:nucleoside 2-deoxyribosyltransferase